MTSLRTSIRLQAILAALAPIDGVSIKTLGDAATVRIDFQAAATAPQRSAAQAALAAFDWSDAAQSAWDDAQHPERTDLVQAATQAVQNNTTYLGLASPNNAQNVAQVQALTQQMNKVIRRLIEIN